MAVLDRFGGPEAWDAYCEQKDREYEAMIEGKTCLDCGRAQKCDREGHENVGYCPKYGEFVTDGDSVKELGMDCFEAAA